MIQKVTIAIALPVNGTPWDIQTAICEAMNVAGSAGDSFGVTALSQLLVAIRTPSIHPGFFRPAFAAPDPTRRCDTDHVAIDGSCVACGADQGSMQEPAMTAGHPFRSVPATPAL